LLQPGGQSAHACACFVGFLENCCFFVWKGFLGDHFGGLGALSGRLWEVLGEAFGGPGTLSQVPGLSWEAFGSPGALLEITLEVLGLSQEPFIFEVSVYFSDLLDMFA